MYLFSHVVHQRLITVYFKFNKTKSNKESIQHHDFPEICMVLDHFETQGISGLTSNFAFQEDHTIQLQGFNKVDFELCSHCFSRVYDVTLR